MYSNCELYIFSEVFLPFCSIDPFLYATLIIYSLSALRKLAFTIRDGTKPASFYKRHVKCFCVWPNDSITAPQRDDLRIVFSACTSIKTVATGIAVNFQDVPWEMLTGMRRLSICVQHPLPNSFITDPLHNFINLTHLEIVARFGDSILAWPVNSKLLTSGLTHLSLTDWSPKANIERVLRHTERVLSSSSVILCILFIHSDVLERLASSQPMWYKQHEPFIVIGCHCENVAPKHRYVLYRDLVNFDLVVKDWGRPPPAGELDMWEMAERISRSQKLLREPKC